MKKLILDDSVFVGHGIDKVTGAVLLFFIQDEHGEHGRYSEKYNVVSYRLINSPNFTRVAKKYSRNNPDFLIELNTVLRILCEDPFHTQLKTHKLKGDFRDF